jgi:Flp pilus assembly protein TadG
MIPRRAPQRCLRRALADDCRGSVAVEFALITGALALIAFNVVDLGVYVYTRMQLELAAEAAVGYARATCNTSAKLPATYPTNHCSSTLQADMQTAAQHNSTLGTAVTLGTLTENYYCANSTTGALAVAGSLSSPSANCSAAVSGSTTAPGLYINVRANYTYSPMFPNLTVTSALPSAMGKTAWMRLK